MPPPSEMMPRLRFAEKTALFLSGATLLVYLFGISRPPGIFHFFLTLLGPLASLFAWTIVSRSRIWKRGAGKVLFLALAAAGFAVAFGLPLSPSPYPNLIYALLFFAAAALPAVVALDPQARAGFVIESRSFWREFWIYLVFAPGSIIWLAVISIFTPLTLDRFFQRVDRFLFGLYPDDLVRQWMAGAPLLARLLDFFYFLLPFYPVVLAGILYLKREKILVQKVTLSFLLCGIIGWCLYLVFPAVGPIYFSGNPVGYPHPAIPRNCFPSLHTAWGLLVLIYAWKYSRKAR